MERTVESIWLNETYAGFKLETIEYAANFASQYPKKTRWMIEKSSGVFFVWVDGLTDKPDLKSQNNGKITNPEHCEKDMFCTKERTF